MTEDKLMSLPEIFSKHICTLKKASEDTTNKNPMCGSDIRVINFDRIPNEYARGRGWGGVPKSNDALYISSQGMWYFIEFKNGNIEKEDIYRKIYDSLIMLIDLKVIPDFSFVREKINYILVYNADKYGRIPKSPAREANYAYIQRLAVQEEKLFDIDKLEQYLLHEVHTYTKELFEENFVRPMEREEGLGKKIDKDCGGINNEFYTI